MTEEDQELNIDWSAISSLSNAQFSGDVIIPGGVVYHYTKVDITSSSARFTLPDYVSEGRVEKAMRLLMNSCHQKSKFD
jgi:hypothetical protein